MSRVLTLLVFTFGLLLGYASGEQKDYSPYPIPYSGYVTDKASVLSESSVKIINKKQFLSFIVIWLNGLFIGKFMT